MPIAPKAKRVFGALKESCRWDPSFSSRCRRKRWKAGSKVPRASRPCVCCSTPHAFLWWRAGDQALSEAARAAIADPENEVFISAASAWEIATKYRLGKLPGAAVIAADTPGAVAGQGFAELPINLRDGQAAGGLPAIHKDPLDRMLIAKRSPRTW